MLKVVKVDSTSSAVQEKDAPENAKQLDDNYEAFDKNSALMSF